MRLCTELVSLSDHCCALFGVKSDFPGAIEKFFATRSESPKNLGDESTSSPLLSLFIWFRLRLLDGDGVGDLRDDTWADAAFACKRKRKRKKNLGKLPNQITENWETKVRFITPTTLHKIPIGIQSLFFYLHSHTSFSPLPPWKPTFYLFNSFVVFEWNKTETLATKSLQRAESDWIYKKNEKFASRNIVMEKYRPVASTTPICTLHHHHRHYHQASCLNRQS